MLNAGNDFDLTGLHALITGGAGLLGPQHAIALAECGAAVTLADIDASGLARAAYKISAAVDTATVRSIRMDVTDRVSIKAAQSELGEVHVLVNNAAIDAKVTADADPAAGTRLETFSLDRWETEIRVGLTGAFLCAQVFGTAMASGAGGVILNIASDLSVIAPDQRLYRLTGVADNAQPVKPVTYSVVKTGLIGLTRYLAGYWAGAGVRVNALSPGGVRAEQGEEFVRKLTDLIPMGRMAAPDEYKAAVKFLCSNASRYMTGQNLVVDGGRTIL